MDKINILRLSPYFYFESSDRNLWDLNYEPVGGMQIQITEQTKAIDKLCKKQVVLTSGLPQFPKRIQFENNTEVISTLIPMPKVKSFSKGLSFLTVSWAIATVIWVIKNKRKYKFDIIHHHTSDLLSTFVSGFIISKLLNIPFNITVHCSPNFTFHPSTFGEKLFFRASKWVEKAIVKKANHIYVLTERLKSKYIDNNFCSKDKISVLPDGVDVNLFSKRSSIDIEQFKKKYNIPLNKKIISYIGRVAPEKGWDIFVKCAYELEKSDLHFLICGDGHTMHQLKQKIGELSLSQYFSLTGYISHLEIPITISASFCVILPSYHEELGGTTLETMACSSAIIASEVGGVPYVVQDGYNGLLFKPGNTNELTSKIMYLLENEDIYARICENARSYVVEKYSITAVANTMYKNYLTTIIENSK